MFARAFIRLKASELFIIRLEAFGDFYAPGFYPSESLRINVGVRCYVKHLIYNIQNNNGSPMNQEPGAWGRSIIRRLHKNIRTFALFFSEAFMVIA